MDIKEMCKGITGIRMQGQAHETQPKPYIRARPKNGPVVMMLKKYNLRQKSYSDLPKWAGMKCEEFQVDCNKRKRLANKESVGE